MFSKPAHVARPRIGPPGANHGPFTTKPSSCHVHSTLQVTPPTSPCPILSADAEPARKRADTIFSTQCRVWRYQKCTTGFKGLNQLPDFQWTSDILLISHSLLSIIFTQHSSIPVYIGLVLCVSSSFSWRRSTDRNILLLPILAKLKESVFTT